MTWSVVMDRRPLASVSSSVFQLARGLFLDATCNRQFWCRFEAQMAVLANAIREIRTYAVLSALTDSEARKIRTRDESPNPRLSKLRCRGPQGDQELPGSPIPDTDRMTALANDQPSAVCGDPLYLGNL